METFKVTPTNIRNGAKAPYYVVSLQVKDRNKNMKAEAEKQVRPLSRLSAFDNWSFEVEKI